MAKSWLQVEGLYSKPCVKSFSIYESSNMPSVFPLQKTF